MALTKVQNTGIADDAITTDKIENSTVVAADIAPGTIANAKLSNSAITINGSSTSLGGSTTIKHIDWQAVTVADGSTQLTAVAGRGYFLDTNTGVIEVFLPSSPSRGDTIVLADYGGTFATNQIIINTGAQLIDSTTGPEYKVTTNNAVVELVYVDANKGWLVKLNQAAGTTPSSVLDGGIYDQDATFIQATGGTVTTSGDYKIHSFTGDGCFVVSCAGAGTSTYPSVVDYVVVAGGGGGAGYTSSGSGGGGAGGYRESLASASPTHTASPHTASPLKATTGITVTATTFPISVGAGGAGSPNPSNQNGVRGSNSVFSTITSTGGGGGIVNASHTTATPGGSGGGAGPAQSAGNGNTPPVSPPQGNNGAAGTCGPHYSGGGGGGAGGAGNPGPSSAGGAGGNGTTSHITGSPVVRAGGGGGGIVASGGSPTSLTVGAGGPGGGGTGGGPASPDAATAGTANTGGGGGGGGAYPGPIAGQAGGKGIVIIRYKYQ